MKVVFSHGKESGPWGNKIKRLAESAEKHGLVVDSIDYTDTQDPEKRVEKLSEYLIEDASSCILVGSSMGGYVSLVCAEKWPVVGAFLLAPALYMDGYEEQHYEAKTKNIEIVHGWADDVIPYQHSMKFAEHTRCALHLIEGDHRLESSIERVNALFNVFLSGIVSNYK